MSSLSTNEKQVLEKLFQMGGGYVLNFSDRTFREFFKDDVKVNIDDARFNYASGSKANRLRGFWQLADDQLTAKSIEKLIAYIDTQILIGRLKREDFDKELIRHTEDIIARLLGAPPSGSAQTESDFISKQFGKVSIDQIGLDPSIGRILNLRIEEIRHCLTAKAPLAAIFLCGSTLEGILLGIACIRSKDFNQSLASPKDKLTGKVKQFQEWSLSDFINVARDLNLVGEDVKKFGHALRDFRNYIHPYEQLSSNFDPDDHTARICWQVLQAAVTDLSKRMS